jgi:hypothetical protein
MSKEITQITASHPSFKNDIVIIPNKKGKIDKGDLKLINIKLTYNNGDSKKKIIDGVITEKQLFEIINQNK